MRAILPFSETIKVLVENLLPERTNDKILYLRIKLIYNTLIAYIKEEGKNKWSCPLGKVAYAHFIFVRRGCGVDVLMKGSLSEEINNGEIYEHITLARVYNWENFGLGSSLYNIHDPVMKDLEKKYKEITGKEMPIEEKNKLPSRTTIDSLEFYDLALFSATHNGGLNFNLKIKNSKISLIQIEKGL